jgi:NurA-like 5'-3' nuclease
MDAQDIRNLQEAYLEVVSNQLDEVLDTPQKTQSYAAKMLLLLWEHLLEEIKKLYLKDLRVLNEE